MTQFLRLARDCKIIDEGQGVAASGSKLTGGSSRRVGPVAVNLAFASVLQRRYRFTVRKSRPLLDVSAFLCRFYYFAEGKGSSSRRRARFFGVGGQGRVALSV